MNFYLRSAGITVPLCAVLFKSEKILNVSWWPTLDLLHEDVKTHVQMQS